MLWFAEITNFHITQITVVFRFIHIFNNCIKHFSSKNLHPTFLAKINNAIIRKFCTTIKTFLYHLPSSEKRILGEPCFSPAFGGERMTRQESFRVLDLLP